MHLTATHINYYKICHRKLWFFTNGIGMEHTSAIVYDGKLLHETSYSQRAEKHHEIELNATYHGVPLTGKIDFYNTKGKIIHETKRGKTTEEAHAWQVKFYIWLFTLNGINGVLGKIEYPRLRKTTEVFFTEPDQVFLEELIPKIKQFIQQDKCPPILHSKICKKCAYYELCYIDEV